MRLFVYDMLVNVNVISYVHVCEQARRARSAGNSAIENLCIIIISNMIPDSSQDVPIFGLRQSLQDAREEAKALMEYIHSEVASHAVTWKCVRDMEKKW